VTIPGKCRGFKTCADVDKAEAEGAFVLYSTDPEAGQVKLLAAFNKLFPKIKTSYVRLQAGALYAKVLSERQAKSYLVDVIQISDMGMILDFQKRGGFRQYVSPEMAAFKPEYKSQPEGYWTWGSIIMGGIAYNPNNVSAAEAPKTWEDLLDPKWTDAINVKVSNSGLQHGIYYVLKPILGEEYFKKFGAIKPRAFDSYVQQYGRLVDGQDKIIMGAQYSVISNSRPRAHRWRLSSPRPAFPPCPRPTASSPMVPTPTPPNCSWTGSCHRSASKP
jgi:iron(III) transport system substrate-binding protein